MAERSQDQHAYDNDGELILTGSANAYVAATSRSIAGYFQGLKVRGKANHTNSGASTLEIFGPNSSTGLGAVAIRKSASTALVSGEIISGKYYTFIYDTTTPAFQVMEVTVPANGTITNAMLADMAESTVKGRAAGAGTGAPQDLTAAQVRTAIGAVNIAGDTMTGNLVINNGAGESKLSLTGAGAAGIELGRTDGNVSTPYIDFHSGATAVDYDARIIASGGSGASAGGTLNIEAASLLWNSNAIGMVLLTSGTVSAAATLDIVLTSYTAYRGFKLVLANFVPATDSVNLLCRFSTDGGSSYIAASYSNGLFTVIDTGASATSGSGSGAAEITVSGTGVPISNFAGEGGITCEISLLNPFSTAHYPRIKYDSVFFSAGAICCRTVGGGMNETAQDCTALRILFSSGNITSGTWALYGLL